MLPTFIVIGAAKAGTTALYWYLAEHPQIHMSPVKETNFFAYGIDGKGQPLFGDPELHYFPIKTLAEYEELFSQAGGAKAVGEVSPMYLECPQSAERIHRAVAGAKIICFLRQPVDRAYSDYLMYLRQRKLDFDPGRDLRADSRWARPDSHWMEIGKYYEPLARYYQRFSPEQIRIFLFDDLKRDALNVVQEVYRFVGVDSAFEPDLETPHNVGGIPASKLMESALTSRKLRRLMEPWIPKRAANWVRRLRTRNMRQPPSLPAALRAELTGYFREDIARTSKLIGRSLDHWL
jgi:Sulfotransferase family